MKDDRSDVRRAIYMSSMKYVKDHIYSYATHGEVNLHDVWDVTYSNAVDFSTSEATTDSIPKTNV